MNGLDVAWNRLLEMEHSLVCKRAQVEFKEGKYLIEFLKDLYQIELQTMKINIPSSPSSKINFDLALVLLTYLTQAKEINLSNKWVSPRDLKSGYLFFTGTHSLEDSIFLEKFGHAPNRLFEVGVKLGAKPASYGDKSIILFPLPRIPLLYLIWTGDDEFEPGMSILLDSTAEFHLPLDILYALIRITTKKLGNYSATDGHG
ncbi:MAG: DUF3786 domain-containing protein [bacterium]